MSDDLRKSALKYHREPLAGKIAIASTKSLVNQRDLALAYSPGVAYACEAIVDDPAQAAVLTARSNLVGVVTNGSAVLGLGDIGPLAAKPVMEGKAVLFKKFAGIDVFDIELDAKDPERMIEIIAALEPTFGAINLEDIKAPNCFEIEEKLQERMRIPVFHDDQHGTAIVAGAAFLNGLRVVGKAIDQVKLVSTGGGAAGLACLDLMVHMGLRRENVTLIDRVGVVFEGRSEDMNPRKARYARKTPHRTLGDVMAGADVFLGLSAPGILKPEMVKVMADKPLILALANPTPEIMPDEAKAVRPDAVIATGRSDYPNQVNNVLCFPFIFRGALDVGATTINEEMKLACLRAIADLSMAESSEVVAAAYSEEDLMFGPEYLIPKPFDPRLIMAIAPAVAKAAMDSGIATRPIEDFDAYRERLNRFVFRTGMLMQPVFERARKNPKRLIFTEGEDERVLRAVQILRDEGLARPILIGRTEVVDMRIKKLGLHIKPGEDVEVVNPESDPRYDAYWRSYHEIMERRGVSPDTARTVVRTNTTVIGALMLRCGEADAMICGAYGQYSWHLRHIRNIIGLKEDIADFSALGVLTLASGTFFFCDTYVNSDPTVEEIVSATILAAEEIKRFGIQPKIALLSHSNFGSANTPTARKMREAARILNERAPNLEVEGEMHADAALNEELRRRIFPNARFEGTANLFVFPTLEAANNAFNLVKILGGGQPVGPILIGADKPVHIVTPSVSARGLVNISAVAVVDAGLGSATPPSSPDRH
ncbi:NADP-dependent malic enzyme [Varunaivibrio sulfuroxidans]|uniref:Malate dehydrogenase (Oxaloacetate-decarboxylating)(NADP+) n=1 Tax=Varunaivibrio sulfuroxidans TaxID=1773489 RepID=A0A4R3JBI9_9PROT|nr:NADP-dependent malic enzyme [Varunaivibrio sulfuroxidans]TCS63072.1 malate dehydrogenase (oxaloacetate-decarboxylating)(NADP+) [Varunaivibrio sulfuroxidans]WES31856.1 NADP-dependent malic enzyme [Varunaivibrio sulfuroxidans]